MSKRVYKIFQIDVAAPNAIHAKDFELDKNITAIHGLLMDASRQDLLYYRGSQKIEINKEEVFPDEYASRLLMSGINAAVNDRFYNLRGKSPGNGKLLVSYKDTDYDGFVFAPYRVFIYLDCEISS